MMTAAVIAAMVVAVVAVWMIVRTLGRRHRMATERAAWKHVYVTAAGDDEIQAAVASLAFRTGRPVIGQRTATGYTVTVHKPLPRPAEHSSAAQRRPSDEGRDNTSSDMLSSMLTAAVSDPFPSSDTSPSFDIGSSSTPDTGGSFGGGGESGGGGASGDF